VTLIVSQFRFRKSPHIMLLFGEALLSWHADRFVLLFLVMAFAIFLCRLLSPRIYDMVIVSMTSKWYSEFLSRMEPSSKIIDIGIGTASALCVPQNARILRERKLNVVGIDYEPRYIEYAKKVVSKANLKDIVSPQYASVYDVPATIGTDFDAAYFSGSISLMPDPVKALEAAAALLKPTGRIYITQTFQDQEVFLLRYVKPLMKYLTTIDFGQLVFQEDILGWIKRANMEVLENSAIPGSIRNGLQTARMLVVKPGGGGGL